MYVEELKYSLRWKKPVANSVQKTNKLKAHLQNWLKDKECIQFFFFFLFVYIQMHCLLNVWFRQVGTTV